AAPGFTHKAGRTCGLTARQQGARHGKTSFRRTRWVVGKKGKDGLRVALLLPEHSFSAAPQQRNARPARIVRDEGVVARETRRTVFAAQDHPFDELARYRICDGTLDAGGFVLAVLAHQVDGLLDGRDLERRGGPA